MMTDISFRIVSNWFKNDYAQNCSRKFRWKKSIGKKPEPWEIDKKLSVGTEEKINKELCFPCQSSSQWLLSLSRDSHNETLIDLFVVLSNREKCCCFHGGKCFQVVLGENENFVRICQTLQYLSEPSFALSFQQMLQESYEQSTNLQALKRIALTKWLFNNSCSQKERKLLLRFRVNFNHCNEKRNIVNALFTRCIYFVINNLWIRSTVAGEQWRRVNININLTTWDVVHWMISWKIKLSAKH